MRVKHVLNKEVKNVLLVFKRVKAKNIRMKQKKGSSSSRETNTFKYSINSREWREVKTFSWKD